jgi:hypothetical protein
VRKFNCLVAATFAATLAATAAHAAVTVYDFEDGVVGTPYIPPANSNLVGLGNIYWGPEIVEDSDGKHLKLPPTNIYNETGLYLSSSGGPWDGVHPLFYDHILVSFDIFLPNGGWVKNYYRFTEWVDAGVWTTVNANIGCGWGCPLYVQAEGGGLLDNIVVQDRVISAPEPGTWALMILGFGGVGAVLRRRRAASLA